VFAVQGEVVVTRAFGDRAYKTDPVVLIAQPEIRAVSEHAAERPTTHARHCCQGG
jgi:hypothetical protein